MSDDRTQAPSVRRRQMARERGQAAHSPVLTSAIGLLAATAALTIWGQSLMMGLVTLAREPLAGSAPVVAEPFEVVARVRHAAAAVAGPLLGVLGVAAVAALTAHQIQVRGLWAPVLLAPAPARLWLPSQGASLADWLGRGFWAIARASAVIAAAGWALGSEWAGWLRLSALDTLGLARASGQGLSHLVLALATATLALGALDFLFQYLRFEAMLRLSPAEQREDFRSMEGDPALRAQRRRIVRAWRGNPADLLAGASLVLTGRAGLTVVLAGRPPSRSIQVRSILSGAAGERLRRASGQAGIATRDNPALAQRLASRRAPGLPLAPDLLRELAAVWPSNGEVHTAARRRPSESFSATGQRG
jgi:flagellar biosynthetic protein FlhB